MCQYQHCIQCRTWPLRSYEFIRVHTNSYEFINIPMKSYEFIKFHMNSYEHHEILWNFMKIFKKIGSFKKQISYFFIIFHDFSYGTMKIYEKLWKIMKLKKNAFLKLLNFHKISLCLYDFIWIYMNSYEFVWNHMNSYVHNAQVRHCMYKVKKCEFVRYRKYIIYYLGKFTSSEMNENIDHWIVLIISHNSLYLS
jgi:hypothetical protein